MLTLPAEEVRDGRRPQGLPGRVSGAPDNGHGKRVGGSNILHAIQSLPAQGGNKWAKEPQKTERYPTASVPLPSLNPVNLKQVGAKMHPDRRNKCVQ